MLLEFSCGVAGETKLATHDFRFRNPTRSAVRVSGVSVSCGCLKVVDPPTEIGAGKSSTFRLELSVKGYVGPVSQSARVTVRDDKIPPLVLKIKTVAPGMQVRPALVDLGKLRAGSATTRDARVFVGGLPAARIAEIVSNDERLTATFDELDVDSEEVARSMAPLADLHVRMNTDAGDDIGKFEALLRIKTNIPDQEILRLPVRVVVAGKYDARPETAFFGTVGAGTSAARTIVLTPGNHDTPPGPARMPDVSTDHDEISAEIASSKEGEDKWKLVIRCAPSARTPAGILRGRVIGRADGKTVFAVPYVAYIHQR